jgi:hypothetical protein
MVATNLNQGSARIYQFPVGGRAGLPGYREPAQPAEMTTARITKAVTSSSWYHEAAVLEDCSKPQ